MTRYMHQYYLGAGPHTDQEPEGKHQPPGPSILIPDHICGPLDYQGPLGEGQTKPCQGAITSSDGVAEAHEEEEANPVEQECSQES